MRPGTSSPFIKKMTSVISNNGTLQSLNESELPDFPDVPNTIHSNSHFEK